MKNNLGSGYGGATLVMLFSVLCMTVFAVLALSSARSQLRLSERYAESVSDYYAADSEAVRVVESLTKSEDLDRELDRLRNEGLDISEEYAVNGILLIDFSCPVRDPLCLDVQLARENDGWTILKWILNDYSEWESDLSLHIFLG